MATFNLYETSARVVNHRNVLAQMLGVPKENVGHTKFWLGFGGKLWPLDQSGARGGRARQLGRPVKLWSAADMFQSVGHRPRIQQRIRLSARADGKLTSCARIGNHTSIPGRLQGDCGEATPQMYSVPNLRITSRLARRNVAPPPHRGHPAWRTRPCGHRVGDGQLALKLGMDPVDLRLANERRSTED